MAYKHVGKIKATGAKVLVAYRTLPGESDSALVIGTASLTDDQHDSIMKVVESQQGQDAYELADILARRHFPDGRQMLQALHKEGKLKKVKTPDVIMTPSTTDTVVLSELNQLIAEQRGVTVDQLSVGPEDPKTEVQELGRVNELPNQRMEEVPDVAKVPDQPLSDEDLAKQYRSQADAMYKEAKRLREQAEALSPTKKATKAKVSESA